MLRSSSAYALLLLSLASLASFACGDEPQDSSARPDGGEGPETGSAPAERSSFNGSADAAATATDGGCIDESNPLPAPQHLKLAPEFASTYVAVDLGNISDPAGNRNFGASAIDPKHPDKILLGVTGYVTGGWGIVELGVARDACGHIRGFVGQAVPKYAVDGPVLQLTVDGSGTLLVLTDASPHNRLGSVKAGASKVMSSDLVLPNAKATGLMLAPDGTLRILSTSATPSVDWYRASVSIGASGASITGLAGPLASLGRGQAQGVLSTPSGSPGFASPSLLVYEGDVMVWTMNAENAPVAGTGRPFCTGAAAGGASLDPATGDYLVPAGRNLIAVRGFTSPPPPPVLK